jgi:hypothetical protein
MNLCRRNLVICLLGCLPVSAIADETEHPPENKLPDEAHVILEKADKFVLYSLRAEKPKAGEETLHDWPIIRKTTVKSAAVRKELLRELDKLIVQGRGASRCFRPRHAIRASHDGKTVDLLLCFECGGIEAYVNDVKLPESINMGGSDDGSPTTVEGIFNVVLPKSTLPK